MKFIRYIPAFLRNKYLLAGTAFAVWMIFFDRNDFFTQYDRLQELKALEKSKTYYSDQIARERKSLEELRNNPAAIEKYAREQYGMKRENEDVFVVINPAKNQSQP
ncbi:Cell division protein FtsB [Cnuella takakiae]|uniref:Cell division protein FtsB n=1 Tax=Cnuella takakiae TaxID=1302690 RepID=A0A1M5DNC3_9BACT|nr:septum formation initiator family protein [Cnuella takakiae]OLY93928.1 septum formation initiator [Cnuella takakiae]SHF68473.1 Cell division protein FtsB [Cnuella takakiae]